MTHEDYCWKSEPWMCHDNWIDCIHGPDLWRMLTGSVYIVTPGLFEPALPCLAPLDCEGECDFCSLLADGQGSFRVPVAINTLPALHENINALPGKVRDWRANHVINPAMPLKTESWHCGLFVVVNQFLDEPQEGEMGLTHVAHDLEVVDDCIAGTLRGVLPHYAIPMADLDPDLQQAIINDINSVDDIVEEAVDASDMDILIDGFQNLSSSEELASEFQSRRYDWRAFLRDVGDECSMEQAK